MSVRTNFIAKVFGGWKDPLSHITIGSGAPTHATDRVGVLYWDYTGEDGYVCTVISGTWVKMNA